MLAIGAAGGTRLRTALVTVARGDPRRGRRAAGGGRRAAGPSRGRARQRRAGRGRGGARAARGVRPHRPPLAGAAPLLRRRQRDRAERAGRPIRAEAVRSSLLPRHADRDPADVAARGAAGVLLARCRPRRLRVDPRRTRGSGPCSKNGERRGAGACPLAIPASRCPQRGANLRASRQYQPGRTAGARPRRTSSAMAATSSASEPKTASSRSRSHSATTSRSPVEVALEVEQEGLDPPLRAAVVRVRADRDRGPVAERRACVDAEARARAGRPARRRSRSESRASRRAGRRATTVPSTSGGRPSSAPRGSTSPACEQRAGCGSTRRSRRAGRAATSKPSRSSRSRSPLRPWPKRNPSPAAITSAPIAPQHRRRRTPRARPRRARASKRSSSTSSTPIRLEQLEPPLRAS